MIEQVKSATTTTNTSNMSAKSDSAKKPTPRISFSISSILGNDADDKKSSNVTRDEELPRVPKIHFATIHHYGSDADSVTYQHFESQVQPRACSTPENEYPSPTPTAVHIRHRILPPHQQISNHSAYASPNFGHFLPYSKTHEFISKSYDQSENRHVTTRTPEPEPETNEEEVPLRPSFHGLEQSSDKSLDSMGESYHQSPSPFKSKKKKSRTVFSRNQVYQLESAFDTKRYLSSAERAGLAASLNLSETQIKIWFQNRRNKWKRQINGEMDEIPIPPVFAASYLQSQLAHPPSLNSYSHVIDSRDYVLRSSLTAPAYYSHPYARPAFLPHK